MAVLLPLFTVAGAGIAFLHATTPDPLADLAAVEPGEVIIVGRIASPPTPVSYGYMADVRVDHLWYDGHEILRGGGVEVFASDLNLGVGDRVRVDGEISLPDSGGDDFDYGRYLATKRISAVVNATYVRPVGEGSGWIGRIHRRTDIALGYGLHPDEAAVVRGMVLGDRSLIPEELDTAFQRSGITHVLAISGQHVAVLAAMIYFVLRAFAVPLLVRSPVTLALIWLYILVAGAPPSAIRHPGRRGGDVRPSGASPQPATVATAFHDDHARRRPGLQPCAHVQHGLPTLRRSRLRHPDPA